MEILKGSPWVMPSILGRFLLFSIGNIVEERRPSPKRKSIHSIRTRHLFPANGIHPVVVGLLSLSLSLFLSFLLSLSLFSMVCFILTSCFSFPIVLLFSPVVAILRGEQDWLPNRNINVYQPWDICRWYYNGRSQNQKQAIIWIVMSILFKLDNRTKKWQNLI